MPRGQGGGPKSLQGKARSSRNAVKHGILSPHPVIIESKETEAAWQEHLDGIIASRAPADKLEELLFERIAFISWRLRRFMHYETAQVNYQVHTTEQGLAVGDAYAEGTLADGVLPEIDPRRVAAYQHLHLIPAGAALDNTIRYETLLHRLLIQTLHELEAMQARRRGEPTHMARLDISSPPQS